MEFGKFGYHLVNERRQYEAHEEYEEHLEEQHEDVIQNELSV